MNKYKLGNIIRKDMLDGFNKNEVSKHRFSFGYLNKLCKKYKISEYTIHNYCCYGEDICCWVDAEHTWMSNEYLSDKELNERIYKNVKHIIKSLNVNIFKRKIFVSENDKYIIYCFPMRDISREDIYLVFEKNCLVEQ